MASDSHSVFLEVPPAAWVASNDLAFAIRDRFPVSPGHTLVVTRRVVPDFFACTEAEKAALMALVDVVRRELDGREPRPDGYNVGFNAGEAAGQTVPHVHVHVIPRYRGDVEDPRGGVRHVIADKANYLRQRAEPLTDGQDGNVLLRAVAPLLRQARAADILAAFVQDSGVALVEDALKAALAAGARVRLLTGDYLEITQERALRRLLDLAGSRGAAGDPDEDAEATEPRRDGRFDVRVAESARLARAFHPKAWRLEGPDFAVAFVGSSNLSKSALSEGVEWNLRVDRHRDPLAWARIAASFEALWDAATPLGQAWIDAYAARVAASPRPLPPGELQPDAPRPPPLPSAVQQEALAALAATRDAGRRRALVVLATGLGKTFLAAFDLDAFARAHGRRPRVLFVAHRRELLEQAASTLRRVWPDARFGWLLGGLGPATATPDVVFASVQKLSRPGDLAAHAPDAFDYVVVDEVHHAAAPSYRRILGHLEPRFLLGLTATPERADDGDVLGLFDDHVAFRVDAGEGIARDLLVPFRYFGLKDTVDYAPIPWKNRRFDPEALAAAVQTRARMERLWSAWNAPETRGERTLVFCASIAHADFVRRSLGERGVRVAVVHTGPDADDRGLALADLEAGRLDAICSVDLFNEGIDCRPVDRVVMLRPTESPVVFLQQLGRGLRRAADKADLVVVDFVGNHRVFLDRVRTLLSLAPGEPTPLGAFLDGVAPTLPAGCDVNVELEAKALLKALLPAGASNEVVRVYREIHAARGRRPTAGELFRRGLNPGALRKAHGGWIGFVEGEGHLDDDERRAWQAAGAWLRELEVTPMTRSFKMVVLEVLLEHDALLTGMPLAELSRRSLDYLLRSPELFRDLEGVRELGDPRRVDGARWRAYWEGPDKPIRAWTGADRKATERAWFAVEEDRFVARIPVPVDAAEALASLTAELVDWRLAQYRRRRAEDAAGAAIEAKVISNQRDPIIKLPAGAALPPPLGPRQPRPVDVRLPDGSVVVFHFAKAYVNVAHRPGVPRNVLPDLLRGWFGPSAGKPGTDFRVRFSRSADGLHVEPVGAIVLPFPVRGRVVAYPTLRAAAGATGDSRLDADAEAVALPDAPADAFAVRAAGHSMDGGREPIRDGDWVLLRWSRGLGLGAVEGRVALVALGDDRMGQTHHLKRVVRDGDRFVLRSDNPAVAPLPADDATVLALKVAVVRPEALAPAAGAVLDDAAAAFGVSEPPAAPWSRVDGHLFVVADGADERVRLFVPDRRPGETAFVLVREGDSLRYLGVGRWRDDDAAWALPSP